MNGTLERVRNSWIRAQLKSPPVVQGTILARLHEVKEIVRLLTQPYMPACQWQGRGPGGLLTATYVGLGYSTTFLKGILFDKGEDPVEQPVGRIPFWRLDEMADRTSSDVVIVEAASRLIRRLPDQQSIVFPQHVEHVADVRGDWEDVQGRFHRTVRRTSLKLVRKYGYDYDVSTDRRDFEEFYQRMYALTTEERHDKRSMPISIGEAYQYFRCGWLLRVKRDGAWIAGALMHPRQDVIVADMSGVRDADVQLIREGAGVAIYYYSLQLANQRGFRGINFLGSGPVLEGGLFQHKRRWGGEVVVSPYLRRLIWLRIQRSTPAVAQFLKETPLITVGQDGRLHGLIVVDDPYQVPPEIEQEWGKNYATPGLTSLIVRAVGNLTGEPGVMPVPDRIVPLPAGSETGVDDD
jgi:hypothetical protein